MGDGSTAGSAASVARGSITKGRLQRYVAFEIHVVMILKRSAFWIEEDRPLQSCRPRQSQCGEALASRGPKSTGQVEPLGAY